MCSWKVSVPQLSSSFWFSGADTTVADAIYNEKQPGWKWGKPQSDHSCVSTVVNFLFP